LSFGILQAQRYKELKPIKFFSIIFPPAIYKNQYLFFSDFDERICIIIIKIIMTSNINVVSALILGDTPLFVIEYTLIDKVEIPAPVVKKLMIKSSSERVNDIIIPLIMPGFISGNIILKNVWVGVAPKS